MKLLHLGLVLFLSTVFVVLSTLNLNLDRLSLAKMNATPPIPVAPEKVDYTKVETMVKEQVKNEIATLPIPKDGKDGIDGVPGKDGKNGMPGLSIQGATGAQGVPGTTGANGIGTQGDIGPPGQQIELRLNPSTLKLECRFTGDTFWTVITNTGNVCP